MASFPRLTDVIIKVLLVIAAVALMAMMLIVVGNSLGRACFRTPIFGAIEYAGLAGVIIVSVAIGYVERERKNVTVDVLTSRLSSRGKVISDIFSIILSLGALGFLLWAMIDNAVESFTVEEVSLTTGTPIAPFKFTWAAGIIILCIYLIRHLIEDIKMVRRR